MKQIFRASLVVLTLAGVYAGFSTPAPAMTNPHNAITVSDTGGSPTPTTPTYPGTGQTSPSNPKTN